MSPSELTAILDHARPALHLHERHRGRMPRRVGRGPRGLRRDSLGAPAAQLIATGRGICYRRRMRSAVIIFPGSNRDRDMVAALTKILGRKPVTVWHMEPDLPDVDLVVLPGGFSYGDYLRSGAIAARSPVMRAVAAKADAGVAVLGICNGFQILCEAGILPGVLMRNASLRFICRETHLRVETADSIFTRLYRKGEVIRCPGRSWRRQLSRRRADAGRAPRRGPDRLSLLGRCRPDRRRHQPQRLDREHRRHPQCPPERARHDAAPRGPDRAGAGRDRRPPPVRGAPRRGRRRRVGLLAGRDDRRRDRRACRGDALRLTRFCLRRAILARSFRFLAAIALSPARRSPARPADRLRDPAKQHLVDMVAPRCRRRAACSAGRGRRARRTSTTAPPGSRRPPGPGGRPRNAASP